MASLMALMLLLVVFFLRLEGIVGKIEEKGCAAGCSSFQSKPGAFREVTF
jgi:hypothetical protein